MKGYRKFSGWRIVEIKKHQVSNKPTLIGGYNKQIDLTPDDVSAFVVEAVHHYWLLNGK